MKIETSIDISSAKKEIRQKMFSLRNNLTKEFCENSSKIIFEKALDFIKDYNSLFIYIDFKNEVYTKSFIDFFIKHNKKVYVPKIIDDKKMIAVKYDENMEKHHFGVLEPKGNEEVSQDLIECAIIPGLAFDEKCGRVGFGKGYYDKFLSLGKNIKKIAVCYDFQVLEYVPKDENDIPMDMIITEKREIFGKISLEKNLC